MLSDARVMVIGVSSDLKMNIILITKYLNLNSNIVKSFIFYKTMIDFK